MKTLADPRAPSGSPSPSASNIYPPTGSIQINMRLTATDNLAGRRLDLNGHAEWLRRHGDELLREIERHAEECRDERTGELLRKVAQYISINQSLVALQLLEVWLQMRENERAIDEELHEISEHVSEILSVHLREAESLRKTL